jgi:hypothetical protein
MPVFTVWDGQRWYPNKRDGYFRNRKGELLHRAVWSASNGPIHEGWQVHHKDEDRSNNDLSNLDAVPVREHQLRHDVMGRRNALRNEA